MNGYSEEQLDLLYRNANSSVAIDVAVGFVITTVLWIEGPSRFAPIWFVALCLGLWARVAFARRYLRTTLPRECLRRWQTSYSLIAVYMGAAWGSLGLFSTLHLSLGYQLLVTFVLLGMAVRTLATKAAFVPAYLDFLLPMFLLPMLGFLMQANSTGTLMAILLGTIIGTFYQCSRQVNQILVSAIRLSADKKGLVSQLITAHEDERRRIAAELHDGIGQSLSAIKYSLENEVTKLSQSRVPRETLRALGSVTQAMQEAIGELRHIAMALRPAMLEDLGILNTLDWFCRTYHNAHPQIDVAKQYALEESEIPPALKVVIYRIVQEAFNNVAKHSSADQVTLELEKTTAAIRLVITDNGQGFDLRERGDAVVRKTVLGFGLASMRERAESVAGEFKLTSGIGSGTTVEIYWPLARLVGP